MTLSSIRYLLTTLIVGWLATACTDAAAFELLVSGSADRSNAIPLDGAALTDDVYIFLTPESGASRVRFFLDNPNASGTPRQTEGNPPWDFNGGLVTSANPFDTTSISDGSHSITAAVQLVDSSTEVVTASFTVANVENPPPVPRAPDQVHLAWVGDPATTLTVVWRTLDLSTPSTVEYRETAASTWQTATGALRSSGTSGTLHEATLTTLTPDTAYEYRVLGDGGVWSNVFSSRTAPSGAEEFSAVYVADTGLIGRLDGLATGTQQVIEEIAALQPTVVLPGGDYAYFDTDKRYGSLNATIDAWFNQMQPVAAGSPLMPTYGNHEALLGEGYGTWASRFPTPEGHDGRRNYSFDIGEVHFVSIFAVENSSALPTTTVDWIEQDILAAKAAGKTWIIPYFHVSPFADGSNHPSNVNLRQQLGPLFEQHGVKLVLASHDQAYERTYPLTDIGVSNTPTSASRSCYTMSDGVTWAKVSPGGKLSSINGSFSQFQTSPAPPWTAIRNNSHHHYAVLTASGADYIRLDTYGVVGDGTTSVVVDSFQYTSGTCPPELRFGAAKLSLVAASGAVASTQVDLASAGIDAADFTVSVDAEWLTLTPDNGVTPATLNVEATTAGLSPGTTHTATVTAEAAGFVSARIPVTLAVTESGNFTIVFSNQANRTNPIPLDGAQVIASIYPFLVPETGVVQVRFYLDDPAASAAPVQTENTPPYDFAGGTANSAVPFDTASLADGIHTITAEVDRSAGNTEIVHATFEVLGLAGNDAPSAVDQSLVMLENGTENVILGFTDADGPGPYTFNIAQPPESGTLADDDGDELLIYTPDPGFVGTDSFTFVVDDGLDVSSEATVTVSVEPEDGSGGIVSGELRKWQTLSVDFSGPLHTESDVGPNPFLDYRLQVEFTSPGGNTYSVPGYFDGDGSGGGTGSVWRVRFTPDESGTWTYRASFRAGGSIAVDLDPLAGTPVAFDGATGTFVILDRDPGAGGFSRYGRLESVDEHYLKFRDGGYWLKMGVNNPENLLGYDGFDNTAFAWHDYDNHVQDWNSGDPDWDSPDTAAGNDGRGIIGILNYLSEAGMNSIYFMPMNIGADGLDAWPYSSTTIDRNGSAANDNLHFDISKLSQWETALRHAQNRELFLHFVLSDKTIANKNELDNATLGVERKLFYRELVARFGHHNALQWNISEEYNLDLPLSPSTIHQFAQYIEAIDPYGHPITVHPHGNTYVAALDPFLAASWFRIMSIQTWQLPENIESAIEYFRAETTARGNPIPVMVDESIGMNQMTADEYRKRTMWDALLSGGGFEMFKSFGDSDLDDFRVYEQYLRFGSIAHRFVEDHLPFWEMEPNDSLVAGEDAVYGGAEVFAKTGEIYAVYLPSALPSPNIDLGAAGSYELEWFNPRTGEFVGSKILVDGASAFNLGSPPEDADNDWVVLITLASSTGNVSPNANDQAVSLLQDSSVDIVVGYTDVDGPGPYTVSVVTAPAHGVLGGDDGDDLLNYTPNPGYTGPDSFTFVVNDGLSDSGPATISITVNPTASNAAPVAADQAITVLKGSSRDITVAYMDPDGPGPYTVTVSQAPAHGALSGDDGDDVLTYTPHGGYTGPDSFDFMVHDGVAQSNEATVNITVNEQTTLLFETFGGPDSDAVGNGWSELEGGGSSVVRSGGRLVFDETVDALNRPMVSYEFQRVGSGRLIWDFDFDWARTGNEGSYRVFMQLGDGELMSPDSQDAGIGVNLMWSQAGSHQQLTSRVGGSVTPLAQISGAASIRVVVDFVQATYDVLVDGMEVGSTIPLDGVLALDSVRFFTDSVNDAKFSGRAFDNVVLTAISEGSPGANVPPSAENQVVQMLEGTVADVLVSYSDGDGPGPYTVSVVQGPSNGLLGSNDGDEYFTYQPNPGFTGTDTFNFVVNDGLDDSLASTVTINVHAAGGNAAPVAEDQVVVVTVDLAKSIELTYSDLDGPGPYSVIIVQGPASGNLNDMDGDEFVTYTPNPGFVGPDSFTFVVNDGLSNSNEGTVSINVSEQTTLLSETFDGADSTLVGSGWTELEGVGTAVGRQGSRLVFVQGADATNRPLVSYQFATVTSGQLVWDFDLDWARTGNEGSYRVFMQLGDSSRLDTNIWDTGVGVNLMWSQVSGHERLAARSGGAAMPLAQVSGPASIRVLVDLDQATYDVLVNGQSVGSALLLDDAVVLDTVRFFTDSVNERNFSGRAFDNVVLKTNGN